MEEQEIRKLGSFQKKALFAGLDEDTVLLLPKNWPISLEAIEEALYFAEIEPGALLLDWATLLYKHRPDYLR